MPAARRLGPSVQQHERVVWKSRLRGAWTLRRESCAPEGVHAPNGADCANRCWRILASADAVFKEFRGQFLGKNSPVHFFWGSFDLAVTRFSGRRAPERPGADRVTRRSLLA